MVISRAFGGLPAVASGRPADAVRAYGGPLLEGFHLDNAAEFEQWLTAERARLDPDNLQVELTAPKYVVKVAGGTNLLISPASGGGCTHSLGVGLRRRGHTPAVLAT